MLEAIACGAYPLLYFNGIKLFDLALDPALLDQVETFHDADALVEHFGLLCRNPEERIKKCAVLTASVRSYHAGELWHQTKTEAFKQLHANNKKRNERKLSPQKLNEPNTYLSTLALNDSIENTTKLWFNWFNDAPSIPSIFQIRMLYTYFQTPTAETKKVKLKNAVKYVFRQK
jgi:hypothetical protein